jgi:hypothetical protein
MINLIGLIGLGFIVGVLSGLFGVGGGFLLTPMLNVVFNIPYNIAVGSSLCQMIGTSTAASLKHKSYGHIDYKLAGLILMGSVAGAESGARLLMQLKKLGNITIHNHIISKMYLWVSVIYTVLLLFIGISIFLESRKAKKRPPRGGMVETRFSQRIQQARIPPNVSLPISRISSISIWNIIGLGFMAGMLSGLLGVGGSFFMNPFLIYLVGIPTHIAIGTGIFQIIFTSGYGALSHFLKGNVNFSVVACVLSGSLIGTQLGAMLNKRLRGAYVRYYFSLIIFISVAIILIKFLFNIGYIGS